MNIETEQDQISYRLLEHSGKSVIGRVYSYVDADKVWENYVKRLIDSPGECRTNKENIIRIRSLWNL